MVEAGTLEERQQANMVSALTEMFNICSNKALMRTLRRFISKGGLNQTFREIEDESIKILAVIMNHLKATQVTQVTEVNLTSMEAGESDEVIFDGVIRKSPDVLFQCNFCDEQCKDAEDFQTHLACAHEEQGITRVNVSPHFDQISGVLTECNEAVRRVNAKFSLIE